MARETTNTEDGQCPTGLPQEKGSSAVTVNTTT